MKHIVLAVFIAITPLLAMAAVPVDGGDRPLLMEGKRSLYQRVLAAPGCATCQPSPVGRGHDRGGAVHCILRLCTHVSMAERNGLRLAPTVTAPAPAGCPPQVPSSGTTD